MLQECASSNGTLAALLTIAQLDERVSSRTVPAPGE